jgi:hypothetical protein
MRPAVARDTLAPVAWSWREQLVALAALAALAASFMPWWAVQVRVGNHYETIAGSAWQTSTRWSLAVLITLAAAAIWLLWRLARRPVPAAAYLVALAGIALAVHLSLTQSWEAWPPADQTTVARVTITASPGYDPDPEPNLEPVKASYMQRDALLATDSPGVYAGVGWGLPVGVATMVFVGIATLVAGPGTAAERRRRLFGPGTLSAG